MKIQKPIKNNLIILFKNPYRFKNSLLNKLGVNAYRCLHYMTLEELKALVEYTRNSKHGIVEIGVLNGCSTREMALYSKVPIYGIDPLIPDSKDRNLVGVERQIKKNLNFFKKFKFYKDFSYSICKNWNKAFDFILIDGNHSYDAVRKDFEDWFPLLNNGGHIAFHDSAPVKSLKDCQHNGYDGPIELVKELGQNIKLEKIETIDSLTIFKKL